MKDLKSYLTIDSTLFSKNLKEDHPLNTLLDRSLEQLTVSKKSDDTPQILWEAQRYNLQNSSFFEKLERELQKKMMRKITELNLSLSYYIEKSGHNYGAKMILLSETLEEKSLYALFAAEEAIHLNEFKNFMDFTPNPSTHWHPMLDPLAKAIEEGERNTLIYVIQVLLEGFGMAHYGGLREDCSYAPLKLAYERILKDEARHHGAGLILAKSNSLSKLEEEQIFEYTREFILSLQTAGWLLECLQEQRGELSTKEKEKFWQDIDHNNKLALRLARLKDMIKKVDNIGLVEKLEREKVFEVVKL